MEYIQTHIGTIVSLLLQSGLLGILWKMYGKYRADIEERNKKEVARDDAIRSLLRTEIISINHKSEEKGFIPIYNLENITDMYRSYKALGGNGAITEIYNKVLQLPQNPPDVENRGCNKSLYIILVICGAPLLGSLLALSRRLVDRNGNGISDEDEKQRERRPHNDFNGR